MDKSSQISTSNFCIDLNTLNTAHSVAVSPGQKQALSCIISQYFSFLCCQFSSICKIMSGFSSNAICKYVIYNLLQNVQSDNFSVLYIAIPFHIHNYSVNFMRKDINSNSRYWTEVKCFIWTEVDLTDTEYQ